MAVLYPGETATIDIAPAGWKNETRLEISDNYSNIVIYLTITESKELRAALKAAERFAKGRS